MIVLLIDLLECAAQTVLKQWRVGKAIQGRIERSDRDQRRGVERKSRRHQIARIERHPIAIIIIIV